MRQSLRLLQPLLALTGLCLAPGHAPQQDGNQRAKRNDQHGQRTRSPQTALKQGLEWTQYRRIRNPDHQDGA